MPSEAIRPSSAGRSVLPRLQRDLPGLQVFAGAAEVLALLAGRSPTVTLVAFDFRGVLLHHDRVRAGRHHAAGHDAHAFPGSELPGNGAPANELPAL